MFFSLFRRLLLILINLFLLSLISYAIFMRDPANAVYAEPSVYEGYKSYTWSLLRGDLGITYNGGDSIASMIFTVLPATLELCFVAILLALIVGVPLGLLGAFQQNNIIGKTISAVSSLGLSLPIFWIAPILLYFAAVNRWEISAVGQMNLLYSIKPVTGFAIIDVWFMDVPYRLKAIQNVLQHLALPSIVLMISPTMEITKFVKQRTEWVLKQNYIKFAVTRGWSMLRILHVYVLRNMLPLLIPQISRLVGYVLALCMLVEGTFGWPGMGRWLIDAVAQQDYNSISVGVIVIGVFIMSISLIAGLCLFLLDPFDKKGWSGSVR